MRERVRSQGCKTGKHSIPVWLLLRALLREPDFISKSLEMMKTQLKELYDNLDALIDIRRMLEQDIELEPNIVDKAEYCVLWAQTQEEIKHLLNLIND